MARLVSKRSQHEYIITIVHSEWNEELWVDVIFFGERDTNFSQLLKIILDSQGF